MFFAVGRYAKRCSVTAVLVVTPWLPGLLAFPLLPGRPPEQALAREPALIRVVATSSPETAPAAAPIQSPPRAAAAAPMPAPPAAEEPRPQPTAASAAPAASPAPVMNEIWVDVSLGRQLVRIYRGNEVIREMVASTGTPDQPTPLGSFRLQNRGEWFYSPKYAQGGFYWVSFKNWGEYLFHSVPTDDQRQIIPEEAAKLGTPASHGCIRLSVEDARWFYQNMPAGARVEIHA